MGFAKVSVITIYLGTSVFCATPNLTTLEPAVLENDVMTWSDASRECLKHNLSLLVPKSIHDASIVPFMKSKGFQSLWVNRQVMFVLSRSDGTLAPRWRIHLNLVSGPRKITGKCGVYREGKLTFVQCESRRYAMCMIKGEITCIGNNHFFASWMAGKHYCSAIGGSLVEDIDVTLQRGLVINCSDKVFGYWTGLQYKRVLLSEDVIKGRQHLKRSAIDGCPEKIEDNKGCTVFSIDGSGSILCSFENCSASHHYQCGTIFTPTNSHVIPWLYMYVCIVLMLGIITCTSGGILWKFKKNELRHFCTNKLLWKQTSQRQRTQRRPRIQKSEILKIDDLELNGRNAVQPHWYSPVAEEASYGNNPCPTDGYSVPVASQDSRDTAENEDDAQCQVDSCVAEVAAYDNNPFHNDGYTLPVS